MKSLTGDEWIKESLIQFYKIYAESKKMKMLDKIYMDQAIKTNKLYKEACSIIYNEEDTSNRTIEDSDDCLSVEGAIEAVFELRGAIYDQTEKDDQQKIDDLMNIIYNHD